MTTTKTIGRGVAAATVAVALMAIAGSAQAQEKITFLTSWKAQAEHGGYYQALANGYFKKYGLDVTIREGGPQVNASQLLAAGAVDFAMLSSNDDLLVLVQNDAKVKAVMAGNQKSPRILISHPGNGITKLEDMKGKPILVSSTAQNTFFAWLRAKYGFEDSQIRKYTFNMAPFIADKMAIQQAYITSEPFIVEKEAGFKPTTFLLADFGYDTYASLTAVPQKWIDTKPAVVQAFVNASIEGWYSYLYGDPTPANLLIKKDNPDMADDVIAFSIKTQKDAGIVDAGDSLKLGIGAMSDERWESHFKEAVGQGVYPKDLDYKAAYTLQFVNKGHAMAMKVKM